MTYPILAYRTFIDGATPPTDRPRRHGLHRPALTLRAQRHTRAPRSPTVPPRTPSTTSRPSTGPAITCSPAPRRSSRPAAITYLLRTDGVAITAGADKDLSRQRTGPLSPNQFAFGSRDHLLRPADRHRRLRRQHYYAIANNQFTDTTTGLTYTLSGNTAVNEGNSYEIFSNLGQTPISRCPDGTTYFVNVAGRRYGPPSGDIYSVFPDHPAASSRSPGLYDQRSPAARSP